MMSFWTDLRIKLCLVQRYCMFVQEVHTGSHQEQKMFLLGELVNDPTQHGGQYSDPPQLAE